MTNNILQAGDVQGFLLSKVDEQIEKYGRDGTIGDSAEDFFGMTREAYNYLNKQLIAGITECVIAGKPPTDVVAIAVIAGACLRERLLMDTEDK